jgi:hypothetical protein
MTATPSRTSRGKRVALLSGLGLILLAILGAFYGRAIYCAWLRAWLVGRWESVGAVSGRAIVWEIEPGGKIEKRVRFLHGIEIEVIAADYRLEEDELVPGFHSDQFADKRYRVRPAGLNRFLLEGVDSGVAVPLNYRRLNSPSGEGRGRD